MNRKRYSFYRESDGTFISRRVITTPADVKAKTPAGCKAIEGHFDRFGQRVHLATGDVIEDASLSASRDAERRRNAALRDIGDLERKQLRPLRELAIDPANEGARQRVAEIDAAIVELRTALAQR